MSAHPKAPGTKPPTVLEAVFSWAILVGFGGAFGLLLSMPGSPPRLFAQLLALVLS